MNAHTPRRGFTLIEMLVCMVIIAILAGIILAYASQARKKAQQTYCLNNMRQLGMTNLGAGTGRGDENMTCPAGATYAMNQSARDQYSVSNPSLTVMLFESQDVPEGTEADVWPCHNGGSNYIYWDGHAVWSKSVPKFSP